MGIWKNEIGSLLEITTIEEYKKSIENILNICEKENLSSEIRKSIKKKAEFMINDFSNYDSEKNMIEAKNRVIDYLKEISENSKEKNIHIHHEIDETIGHELLYKILDQFYLFVETFYEKEPNKRATIKREQLNELRMGNEYDVQHILFSIIRLFFTNARTEVCEDTGYAMVRSDIWIPNLDTVVEIKCSNTSMNQKKLMEEIASDMVHYHAKIIYFFIYDKDKIIKNREAFINTYEKAVYGRKIHIILHQPKIL